VTGQGQGAEAGLRRTPTSATQNVSTTITAVGSTDVVTANANITRQRNAKIAQADHLISALL